MAFHMRGFAPNSSSLEEMRNARAQALAFVGMTEPKGRTELDKKAERHARRSACADPVAPGPRLARGQIVAGPNNKQYIAHGDALLPLAPQELDSAYLRAQRSLPFARELARIKTLPPAEQASELIKLVDEASEGDINDETRRDIGRQGLHIAEHAEIPENKAKHLLGLSATAIDCGAESYAKVVELGRRFSGAEEISILAMLTSNSAVFAPSLGASEVKRRYDFLFSKLLANNSSGAELAFGLAKHLRQCVKTSAEREAVARNLVVSMLADGSAMEELPAMQRFLLLEMVKTYISSAFSENDALAILKPISDRLSELADEVGAACAAE